MSSNLSRFIGRLDIKGQNLVKGRRYEGYRVHGSPLSHIKEMETEGFDEFLILDVFATVSGLSTLETILPDVREASRIPLTVGGGIRSLSDASRLFSSGADKVALNSILFQDKNLVHQIADIYGSQALVASAAVDTSTQPFTLLSSMGRNKEHISLDVWCDMINSMPIGEVLITSVINDGKYDGIDSSLLKLMAGLCNRPLIYSGGVNLESSDTILLDHIAIFPSAIDATLPERSNKMDEMRLSNKLSIQSDTTRFSPTFAVPDTFTVGIVDYRASNLNSLKSMLHTLGMDCLVSNDPDFLISTDLLLMPGVGNFKQASSELQNHPALYRYLSSITQTCQPLIGICLGMQIMFERSEEGNGIPGLGLFQGGCEPFISGKGLNVGFSSVDMALDNNEYENSVFDNLSMYFTHRYNVGRESIDLNKDSDLILTSS